MEKGKVKFFNEEKGFGFIQPLNGSTDLFVHITGIDKGPLNEGDTVVYEVGDGKKGPCAVKVSVQK